MNQAYIPLNVWVTHYGYTVICSVVVAPSHCNLHLDSGADGQGCACDNVDLLVLAFVWKAHPLTS